jgi:hypothetical protein
VSITLDKIGDITVEKPKAFPPIHDANVDVIVAKFDTVDAATAVVAADVVTVNNRVTTVESSLSAQISAVSTQYWLNSGSDIYNINSGNVGIGISAPVYKLDVNDTVQYAKISLFSDYSSGLVLASPSYKLENNGGTAELMLESTSGGNKVKILRDNYPSIVVNNNNWIGFGVDNPTTALDISGGTVNAGQIQFGQANISIKNDGNELLLRDNVNGPTYLSWLFNMINKSIGTQKGDTIVFSASNDPSAYHAGQDNTIVKYDSSTATGLNYVTNVFFTSGGVAVSGNIYVNGQTINTSAGYLMYNNSVIMTNPNNYYLKTEDDITTAWLQSEIAILSGGLSNAGTLLVTVSGQIYSNLASVSGNLYSLINTVSGQLDSSTINLSAALMDHRNLTGTSVHGLGTASTRNVGISAGYVPTFYADSDQTYYRWSTHSPQGQLVDHSTPNTVLTTDSNGQATALVQKNAFNVDFGTTTGTAASGNHVHIPTLSTNTATTAASSVNISLTGANTALKTVKIDIHFRGDTNNATGFTGVAKLISPIGSTNWYGSGVIAVGIDITSLVIYSGVNVVNNVLLQSGSELELKEGTNVIGVKIYFSSDTLYVISSGSTPIANLGVAAIMESV